MRSITASPSENESHVTSYPKFVGRSLWLSTEGSFAFYAWMTTLTALFLVGANAWANQVAGGMIGTNMTDQVSWGLYIANFTFMVGLAAGGVMMVIPAYLYHDRKMHDVVIIGELLAIAAIVMCLMFVVADLGRPDRFWHMLPIIGKFNWPISMLTWDVIVLNGYLVLNLHICGYLLYMRFLGRKPNPTWYIPFVMLSIVWAISIHTVTAFLYCGLGGRPFWNTALLAPRFLASAFVSGPAFIIVTMILIKRLTGVGGLDHPIETLTKIIRVTILINLLMVASELFTEFYTGGSHVSSAKYLFFGLHGKTALVPWTWTAIALNVTAALLFLWPGLLGFRWRPLLVTACAMSLVFAKSRSKVRVFTWAFFASRFTFRPSLIPSSLESIWSFRTAIVPRSPLISGWSRENELVNWASLDS